MPKTRFQKTIFKIMMALFMVYGMEVYNNAIRNGKLYNAAFVIPIEEFVILAVIVFVLQTFVGNPLAKKLAFKIVNPETDRFIAITLAISVMTVCCMCPMMSLVATIFFKGVDGEFAAKWIQTFALNLPMAFFWQILVAGPSVRFLYKRIF